MNRCMKTTLPSGPFGFVNACVEKPRSWTRAAWTLCSMLAQISPTPGYDQQMKNNCKSMARRTVRVCRHLEIGVSKGVDVPMH